MRKEGAECFWWKTLVRGGPDAENWGDSPTSRKIGIGDMVALDFTPVCDGYAADIGRTFVFGEPTHEQMAVLELTRRSLGAGISALRDGATLGEVVGASMKVVRGSPYERLYLGPGHCIGLYADVYPGFFFSVSKLPTVPKPYLDKTFVKGMTVAMEVVISVPGVGRVCYEDDYLVGSGGAEKLTNVETILSTAP